MTIELFLQVVFQVTIAIAFTAFCMAGAAVSIYYSWKMAENLIKRRDRYVKKLSKHVNFIQSKDNPNIRMVKQKRVKAN